MSWPTVILSEEIIREGFGIEEVTDSGATAMCLEMARLQSGEFGIGTVSSWCKSSKADVESVMRLRCEPFCTRPIGINMALADALFAQAVADEHTIGADEVNQRVHANYQRALHNPRGMRHAAPGAGPEHHRPFTAGRAAAAPPAARTADRRRREHRDGLRRMAAQAPGAPADGTPGGRGLGTRLVPAGA